jgi:preprotein translocase subunit SecG
MYVILGIILFVSVLLVGVVLLQNSKGGGLTSQFAGAGASQILGVKRTADFLERATWVLIIGLIGLTLLSNVFMETPTQENAPRSINRERAAEKSVLPPAVTPPPAPADTAK